VFHSAASAHHRRSLSKVDTKLKAFTSRFSLWIISRVNTRPCTSYPATPPLYNTHRPCHTTRRCRRVIVVFPGMMFLSAIRRLERHSHCHSSAMSALLLPRRMPNQAPPTCVKYLSTGRIDHHHDEQQQYHDQQYQYQRQSASPYSRFLIQRGNITTPIRCFSDSAWSDDATASNTTTTTTTNEDGTTTTTTHHQNSVEFDYAEDAPTFDSLTDLHPDLKEALRRAKLTKMTQVQHKTWEAASRGSDVLARARTGTGKTVAFLLPALQQLYLQHELELKAQEDGDNATPRTKGGIKMLVLSPTRELASQILSQADLLTATNRFGFVNQVIFGGTPRGRDISLFQQKPPTILVATPGRLKDHLQNSHLTMRHSYDGPDASYSQRPFASLLEETSIVVLDETDRYVHKYILGLLGWLVGCVGAWVDGWTHTHLANSCHWHMARDFFVHIFVSYGWID
jgi:hypothetical protein